MISKYLLPIVGTLAVTGWIAAAFLGMGYIEKGNEVIEEREKANTRTALAVASAEKLQREISEANNEQLLKDMASKFERERVATNTAKEATQAAERRSEKQLQTIEKLMVEASIDDIPDSTEALNVFIPESAISGLRLRPHNCGEAGGSSRPGTDTACVSSPGAIGNDFPAGDFSNITYGDGIKLWALDRATIRVLNSRILAIGLLDTDE